jgi:hypothetical protein
MLAELGTGRELELEHFDMLVAYLSMPAEDWDMQVVCFGIEAACFGIEAACFGIEAACFDSKVAYFGIEAACFDSKVAYSDIEAVHSGPEVVCSGTMVPHFGLLADSGMLVAHSCTQVVYCMLLVSLDFGILVPDLNRMMAETVEHLLPMELFPVCQ